MDGSSGPGVGTARIVAQEGGVGVIMFGVTGAVPIGVVGVVAQAEMRKKGRRNERNLNI